MVGREVGNYFAKAPTHRQDEVLLSVRGLCVDNIYRDVAFDLRKGEILCMAGLIGARRTDVALTIFGLLRASAGQMTLRGRPYAPRSAKEAIAAGVAYVSEDRRKYGLAVSLPVRWNMTLAALERYLGRFGLIDVAGERAVTMDYRARLEIRVADIDTPIARLSGGNQQKVMLAKWLQLNPALLIVDEPTRGVDVGAKAEVHDLIRKFVADGGAALVVSSDLPEVLALGDRDSGHARGPPDGDPRSQRSVAGDHHGAGDGPGCGKACLMTNRILALFSAQTLRLLALVVVMIALCLFFNAEFPTS